MAQLFATATRPGRVTLPNDATNVSAGNFAGASSLAGEVVGTANGRTRMATVRFAAQGSTAKNLLRVYREKISSGAKSLVASIPILKITIHADEDRPPWSYVWEGSTRLFSSDYRFAYQLEAVPGSVITVDEEAVDSA